MELRTLRKSEPRRIRWPDGKEFAFTIFDDTDESHLATVKPVYDFLAESGFRTTKSVWPLRPEDGGNPQRDGSDCEDPDYLRWVLELQSNGFEIGLHLVASRTSRREHTIRGLERFRDIFGDAPITCANHLTNLEGMYFGRDRLSGWKASAYAAYLQLVRRQPFGGHREGDPHYWGDYCQRYVKYFRNFVFGDVNTLKACPEMPYHDSARPLVPYWFASSEGKIGPTFLRTISEPNQDRLAAEGGACIMYTHFAYEFCDGITLVPRFKQLMRRLVAMNGWFVPVRTLLDYLLEVKGHHELSPAGRKDLEWRWLIHKSRTGRS